MTAAHGHFASGGIDDRIASTLPPVLQAEDRAAVVEQVELDVAAAADELLVAVGFGPRRREVAPDELRIDVEEGEPDVAGEGEVGLPVAAVEPVVEDAADAAHLVPVLEEEVLVAPFLVAVVVGDRVAVAGGAASRRGSRCVSGSSCVRRRSSTGVRSAPPPNHCRLVTTIRVFMWTAGTLRVLRMDDQRDAARPEARVLLGAGDLLAELGREFAVDGGDVDAGLLEDAAMHDGHDAAAAVAACLVASLSTAS